MADEIKRSPTPASDPYAEIPSQQPDTVDPALLPELDLTDLSRELQAEEAYGDRPGEAFLGEAVSTATLGLSDAALRAAGVPAERLREVRERSPEAATAGTITGAVVPAAASLGTSALAQTTAAGFRAAEAAGAVTRAAIKEVAQGKIKGKAAQRILEMAAQGVGEGAAVGAGQALKDAALGNKELTAENIVASAGSGALLGAGFGAAFGTAAATMPVVKKGFSGIGSKLKDRAVQMVDPVDAAVQIVAPGRTATQASLKQQFGTDLVDYFQKDLGASALKTVDDYAMANSRIGKVAAKQIDDISTRLDELITKQPEAFGAKRIPIYSRLLGKLDEFAESLGPQAKSESANVVALNSYRRTLKKLSESDKPFSFQELNKLRKDYGELAKYRGVEPASTFKAKIARTLYPEARGAIDELAIDAGQMVPGIGDALKEANRKAHISLSLQKPLAISAQKGSQILSWADAVETGVLAGAAGLPGLALAGGRKFLKSTVAKNLTILANINTQREATSKLMSSSLKNFFQKTAPRAKKVASPQVLVNSGFAINKETGKVPKTKHEAFKQLATNISTLTTDPELLANMLARTTARVALVSPVVAQETQATLARAVAFLAEKLPKDASPPSLFQRPYQPSDAELAKFERYVQAVEQPLSVLEDLEQGTLTREHVQALQVVYPSLYTELRTRAIEMLSEDPSIAYSKKLQISMLLDIPGDSALDPDVFLGLQGNFANQPQTAPTGGVRQPVNGNVRAAQAGNMDEIDMAGRNSTETQLLEGRKA